MKQLILTASASLLLASAATAQVRLPRLISDGLILQRDAKAPVWGWAAPGEAVALTFDGKTYKATTGANGKWQLTLPPHKAGGPYDLSIKASNQLTIKNVLVGDVWLCSGQSNMEMLMMKVKDRFPAVVAGAANPNIRQFKPPMRYVFDKPQEDFTSGSWEAANPQSVLQFTAVGYFMAQALYEKYHVPIGIINSSVGGSPAEAWMSAEGLKDFQHYAQYAVRLADTANLNNTKRQDAAAVASWYKRLGQQDQGLLARPRWYTAQFAPTDWKTVSVPARWNEYDGPKSGTGWYRKEIEVPAAMVGQVAQLTLGNIVDRDSTFINGHFVGTNNNRYPQRNYTVPAGVLKAGRNVLVVRVISTNEAGGFVRDKVYQLQAAGQTLPLNGQWQYHLGTPADPMPTATVFQYQPEGLYNGMIAPLLPFAIKGVAWYQGESNTGKSAEYQKLFPALITDWRSKWHNEQLPFVYVQLANYMATKDQPGESRWAELRDVQRRTLALPYTGMAVAIDVGEWNDVHPLDKQTVGQRLALAAEAAAYGEKKIISAGPLYQSMSVAGNKATLTFTSVGKGLENKGGGELKYFSIAGADKKFAWAQARIEGDKVVVWSDQVPQPVAVRYAWADNPIGANLYNKEGLPASPFRTDN